MTQQESKTLLNQYIINTELSGGYEYIGSGSNGHVYLLANGLAIKLTTDLEEVNTAISLKQENISFIVQYHQIEVIDDIGYILMDYIKPLNLVDDSKIIYNWDSIRDSMEFMIDKYNLDINELHWGNCGYYNGELILFDMKFKV